MKTKVLSHPYLHIAVFAALSFNAVAFAQGPSAPASDTSSVAAELPDAPSAQVAQQQEVQSPSKPSDHAQINPIGLLSPRYVSGQPLSVHDKFEIYIHKAYAPGSVIYPAFSAGFRMAFPINDYPREWKDGMGAFGRNYSDTVARRTAKTTAEFMTQVAFHEDPRYARSTSTNGFARLGHAIGATFIDKSDSGHNMLAISTFTGAAAGSFVGMGYLPDGYNDAHHAGTRMLGSIGGKAFSNALVEFEPQWGPVLQKLHIPHLLPAWWTTDHK